MRTRQSAAYKGIVALLIKEGSEDFIGGDPILLTTYAHMAIDIHHIFPAAYCQKQGYEPDKWKSIINKAPLTAPTNRAIGGDAPSKYLATIESTRNIATSRLNEIVETHAVSAQLLRADDFEWFIQDRASRLLDLIEQAMGKRITGRDSDEVKDKFGDALITLTNE